MNRPEEIANPDIEKVRQAVRDYMDFLHSEEYHEDGKADYRHWIYEAALEAFYGKDVWKYTNSLHR